MGWREPYFGLLALNLKFLVGIAIKAEGPVVPALGALSPKVKMLVLEDIIELDRT